MYSGFFSEFLNFWIELISAIIFYTVLLQYSIIPVALLYSTVHVDYTVPYLIISCVVL
jgi:hypothetical protein